MVKAGAEGRGGYVRSTLASVRGNVTFGCGPVAGINLLLLVPLAAVTLFAKGESRNLQQWGGM